MIFPKVGQNLVYSPETKQGMKLKLCQNVNPTKGESCCKSGTEYASIADFDFQTVSWFGTYRFCILLYTRLQYP